MFELFPTIAAYFSAPADADASAVAQIFTDDAIVHDEHAVHTGPQEIRAWRMQTQARTPFVARPLELVERDGAVIVTAEVSGAFPNSPVLLDHSFTLREGLIAELEIH